MTWTASFEAQSKVISRFGTAAAAASWANADNETGHIDAEWSRPVLGLGLSQINPMDWMDLRYAVLYNADIHIFCSTIVLTMAILPAQGNLYPAKRPK